MTSSELFAVNVGAMLLAFIGVAALVNLMFGGTGGWFGYGAMPGSGSSARPGMSARRELQFVRSNRA